MTPLLLSHFTATTCLGRGLAATREALRSGRSGLAPCSFETVSLDTWLGEVAGVDDERLPAALARYDCRNNRLTQLGLETDGFAERVRLAIERYGRDRVGVFLGTSTAGILQTELAYRRRDPASGALPADFNYRTTHNSFSLAEFTRDYFGLEGMAMAISTACSSSAKVFAAAARQLALGTIDAAIVGGVDSLCLTTLYGFSSLELTSAQPCRPYDAARNGISIGEGAAFALLERPAGILPGTVLLLGTGESSDAYHMSSPHPEGLGARLAMAAALR
ncbi:MAG TPA: beta-ketoacyl synthase N-terminal-like domain-containing protein, partial [Azonexus sp.]